MRAINFFIAIPPTKPAGLLYSTKPWSPPSMSITVIPDTSPASGTSSSAVISDWVCPSTLIR